VAKYLLGRDVAAFVFITPFLLSSLSGSLVAYGLVFLLDQPIISKYLARGDV